MTLQVSLASQSLENAGMATRLISRRWTTPHAPWPEDEARSSLPSGSWPEPFQDDLELEEVCSRQTEPIRRPSSASTSGPSGITVERRRTRRKTYLQGAAGHRHNLAMYNSDPGMSSSSADYVELERLCHSPQSVHAFGLAPVEEPFADAPEERQSSGSACPGEARAPDSTVLKKLDESELDVYFQLWHVLRDDPVLRFVPKLHGIVEETDSSGVSSKYLRMENLLHSFRKDARVMDVKLGVRTYLETECSNTKRRPDLFRKMKDSYPWELTDAEIEEEAVTKHRWMSIHDANTTSLSLGFRLDGVAGYSKEETEDRCQAFRHLRTRSDVGGWLQRFAEDAASPKGCVCRTSPLKIAKAMTERLRALREAFQASAFFQRYECIGSSALLVADGDGKASVFWIDFAKLRCLPEEVTVSHRESWHLGNHEDGVLTGVDGLVALWGEVADRLAGEDQHAGEWNPFEEDCEEYDGSGDAA